MASGILPFILVSITASAPPAKDGPEQVVQALFADHLKHDMAFTKASLARKSKWLSPDFLARLKAEQARPGNPDEVPNIDGDPFTDSQEYPTRFVVGKATTEGQRARVPVRFSGKGAQRTLVALLRNSPDGWRVDDLVYEDGKTTLRSLLGK